MDNSELLKKLIAEQQKTNELLGDARRARVFAEREAERQRIAEREGVHPSMVAIAEGDNPSIRVVAIKRDPRHAEPI